MYGFGIVMTAVLTLFTPLTARLSVWFLVGLRVAEGLCEVCLLRGHLLICSGFHVRSLYTQGVTYPAMHSMLGVWTPVAERTRFAALSYSGAR